MPSYTVDSNPYILDIGFSETEEEITNNINAIILLPLDDIPANVSAIVGYDISNNTQVYKPGYAFNNFDQIDNDNIVLRCGGSYIIWSDSETIPYNIDIPDCLPLDDRGVVMKWYCGVSPTGDPPVQFCLELPIDSPLVVQAISGPYNSEAECQASCGEAPTDAPTYGP